MNRKLHLTLNEIGIESNGDITVNFPEQNRWTGLLSEMERVEPAESNVSANPPSPLLGSFDSATVAAALQGICHLFKIFFALMFNFYLIFRSWRNVPCNCSSSRRLR